MLVDALKFGTLGLFSAMGGWILYTDFRFQKIRNRVLLWGLAAAAASYGLALLATLLGTVGVPLLGGTYFTWSFYGALLFHALLSAGAAVALWQLKIWPAGDAKLFALFGLLLPLVDTTFPDYPGWLFMTVLINIFLPPALFIVSRAVGWGVRRSAALLDPVWRASMRAKAVETWTEWRQDPHIPGRLLKTFCLHQLFYISYFLVIFMLRDLLPASAAWMGPLLGVALMLTVGQIQHRAQAVARLLPPLFAAGGAWMVYRYGPEAAFRAVLRGLQFSLTVGLAAELAYYYLSQRETCAVKVDDLRPFQVLADDTLQHLRRDIVFLGENFNLSYKDGIQPDQLEPLKSWLKRHDMETALVYNTTPFAPWIVFGFFLTLLLRTDISWLMRPAMPLPFK